MDIWEGRCVPHPQPPFVCGQTQFLVLRLLTRENEGANFLHVTFMSKSYSSNTIQSLSFMHPIHTMGVKVFLCSNINIRKKTSMILASRQRNRTARTSAKLNIRKLYFVIAWGQNKGTNRNQKTINKLGQKLKLFRNFAKLQSIADHDVLGKKLQLDSMIITDQARSSSEMA